MKAIRVFGVDSTDTRRYENATFTVHEDGDLTIRRDERMIAVWARGQWQHVDAED